MYTDALSVTCTERVNTTTRIARTSLNSWGENMSPALTSPARVTRTADSTSHVTRHQPRWRLPPRCVYSISFIGNCCSSTPTPRYMSTTRTTINASTLWHGMPACCSSQRLSNNSKLIKRSATVGLLNCKSYNRNCISSTWNRDFYIIYCCYSYSYR